MLNLIDTACIGKRVNLIYQYKKPLLKCIEEKLWIYHMHQWWSPYEFALEYGRSWILVFDEDTEMKCPYEVLKDRLGTIEMMRVSGLSTSEILRLEQKCLEFKEKVNAYYLGRWDERLKESINANKWM